MKFGLMTVLFAVICCCHADEGKTKRLLAALNGGMLPVMNGRLINGANPVLLTGGLNSPVAVGGGAGFIGQPQFAQFVPAFGVPIPISNMYPLPSVNAVPFMAGPQMAPMILPQQPMMGFTGGAVPQQPAIQPDLLRRFRRQIGRPEKALKENMDTQIPAPTESTTTTTVPCDERHEDN